MQQRYGIVFLIGSMAGSSIVFSRFALAEIQPTLLLTLRMAIALGCFVVMLALVRPNLQLERQLWLDSAIIGILAIGLPLEFSFLSLRYLSSGLFTIVISFTGIATMLVARLMSADEPVTATKFLGAGIAFAGVATLIATRSTGLAQQGDLRGYLFALIVVLLFSVGNVYARRRLRRAESWLPTAIGIGASFIISLPFTFVLGWGNGLSNISPWSWSAAIYSGIVGSFLYFNAIYWTIKRYGATTVGLAFFVTPVVSSVLGALLLGEIVTGGMLLGASLVLLGLVVVNRPSSAPAHLQSR